MEKKTKHRILGVFVLIGLVVILLPLFQDGKDAPAEVTSIKAPPFPGQSSVSATQVTQNALDEVTPSTIDEPTDNSEKASSSSRFAMVDATIPELDAGVETSAPKPIAAPTPSASEVQTDTDAVPPLAAAPLLTDSKTIQEKTLSNDKDENKNQVNSAISNAGKEENASQVITKTQQVTAAIDPDEADFALPKKEVVHVTKKVAYKKVAHQNKPTYRVKSMAQLSTDPLPTDTNGLIKLKKAVWVIQLGSFKNKSNALRLVNKLRAGGYRAFIQQVSTSAGENTRVFVGPETRQASARAIATQLEAELHIRGIVLSYKPFTL